MIYTVIVTKNIFQRCSKSKAAPYKYKFRARSTSSLIAALLTIYQFIFCLPAYPYDHLSHALAIEKIRDYLNSPGIMEIKNIKYTNGYEQDHNHYIVVANYSIIFKKPIGEIATSEDLPRLDNKNNSEQIKAADNYMIKSAVLAMALRIKYGDIHRGDAFDESCEFIFLRTENGWIVQKTNGDAIILASHINQIERQKEQEEQKDKEKQLEEQRREAAQSKEREYIAQATPEWERLKINCINNSQSAWQGASLTEMPLSSGLGVYPQDIQSNLNGLVATTSTLLNGPSAESTNFSLNRLKITTIKQMVKRNYLSMNDDAGCISAVTIDGKHMSIVYAFGPTQSWVYAQFADSEDSLMWTYQRNPGDYRSPNVNGLKSNSLQLTAGSRYIILNNIEDIIKIITLPCGKRRCWHS